MIIVPPEADLVARLDPELISQRLWDDNLTLGADTVSHTHEYNLATLSLPGMCNRGSDTRLLAPYSSGRADAFVQRTAAASTSPGCNARPAPDRAAAAALTN
jgi:hypothetical protein